MAGTATWSSRLGFILATVGAAVGLGNFWRFPYLAGENGGGAFVLVYLICIFAVAIPLAMTELLIGRRARKSAVSSTKEVAVEVGASSKWSAIGWMGMIATFLIGTFYCVIGGWVIFYIIQSVTGGFSSNPDEVSAAFDGLLASPLQLIFYQIIFVIISVMVPVWGVNKGIERAVNVLMPTLLVMMLGLVVFAGLSGGFGEAVTFLFSVDFSKITAEVVLAAIGQAFFSVGIGMAILLTYGAYLDRGTKLPGSATLIAIADTGVAVLAGLVIFPLVFANDLDPGQGPGLVFVTLPLAFGQMAGGAVIGLIFFTLLLFAALTSSIAIVEIVASFMEER
ncbi:MAG: sodium-dependent transporter, partial [Alphaproteobacteria bacterium]